MSETGWFSALFADSLVDRLQRCLEIHITPPTQTQTIMAHASWNGTLLADSDQTIQIEGNHYFPLESVNQTYLRASSHTSVCSWKGTASYYDVVVDDKINAQAAWYYPEPLEGVTELKGYVAFWKGVKVEG